MAEKYGSHAEEQYLHEYAQHNENCEKVWGMTESTPERSEFQRDRERIVNAKAFRRMVDKAQIFTSSKGDHYRTRMTHTMEVAQIARSIANSLALNIDLTEAIALGHDLGHTPFGHQGERTLCDILMGHIDVGLPPMRGKNVYGGFKHNFQSVRMLNCLEEKYVEYEGLDVSYQVLEGVLKHTRYRQKECSSCILEHCTGECCDLEIFLGEGDISRLFTEYSFPTTLEGQAAAIADEIAQRGHDVDDAMSAGLLEYDELMKYLSDHQMKPLQRHIEKSYQKIITSGRPQISVRQMICSRIISDIVNYLVNDAVRESRNRIALFKQDAFYKNEHRFSECLVNFSKEGADICKLLENMVTRKVLNSSEVARFDHNASRIVKTLFQTYYGNPRLLHANTLRKAVIDMRKQVKHVVDFVEEDPREVQAELDAITDRAVNEGYSSGTETQRENWIKHVILVRTITDYIAGMTDSYAMNEYRSFLEFGFESQK